MRSVDVEFGYVTDWVIGFVDQAGGDVSWVFGKDGNWGGNVQVGVQGSDVVLVFVVIVNVALLNWLRN